MDVINDLLAAAADRAAELRKLPESTYRLQFHAKFTFADATAIVPYLRDLGVTHLYASPYLRARPGSTHGYDVIDHNRLNPELGTQADYDAWVDAMRAHGLSHVLDTVPNHAGVATNDNAWWNDVLEHGPASPHGNHFDIAWRDAPRADLRDKVLLPVLGSQYGEVLEKGELRLVLEDGGVRVAYYDRRFPVSLASFRDVAGLASDAVPTQARVDAFNGTPGDSRSFDKLDALLHRQHYRLAYWRTASDEINYRRFFDINDLAAMKMERLDVFEAAHALTYRLLASGNLAGLRIDHPDGLYDPATYFVRLQRHYLLALAEQLVRTDARFTGRSWEDVRPALLERLETSDLSNSKDGWPLYVVAEKILAQGEPLPPEWAVHGTSGYDFMIMANSLFVDRAGEDAFTRLYADLTGDPTTFPDLVYEKKRLILRISLAGDLHVLARRLDRIAQRDRRTRDFTLNGLHAALGEVIACFPVYRSYVSEDGLPESDRPRVERAIDEATRRNPKTDASVFHFVRDVLLLKYRDGASEDDKADHRQFAGKFQQLTAPVTAKGVEDTAFYIYNRLISLNEVGGEPDHFGVSPESLHAYLADRQAKWPYAMSALSTHDTKRSEDVRARINVLSEIPDEWREHVDRWRAMNVPLKREVNGRPAPDVNEEYLLYQTLVGAWPLGEPGAEEHAAFVKRVQAYMEKALREAKVHTSWTQPDAAYDAAVQDFVAAVLDESKSGKFLADFRAFQKRVSHYGLLNSLSQTLLRLTAPGVPDTYQGTELWDFSLVDPDNRRPVDYARRRAMLDEVRAAAESAGDDRATLARELIDHKEDGRVKLYVTWQALTARRDRPGLFTAGEYLPAEVTGSKRDHVFAFARRRGEQTAIVIVPRLFTRLAADGKLPLGRDVWQDTAVVIPGFAGGTFRNVLTGKSLAAGDDRTGRCTIRLSDALSGLPVALLLSA